MISLSPVFCTCKYKPVRPVVYVVHTVGIPSLLHRFSYWNGKRWGLTAFSAVAAQAWKRQPTVYPVDARQGLATKPEY